MSYANTPEILSELTNNPVSISSAFHDFTSIDSRLYSLVNNVFPFGKYKCTLFVVFQSTDTFFIIHDTSVSVIYVSLEISLKYAETLNVRSLASVMTLLTGSISTVESILIILSYVFNCKHFSWSLILNDQLNNDIKSTEFINPPLTNVMLALLTLAEIARNSAETLNIEV